MTSGAGWSRRSFLLSVLASLAVGGIAVSRFYPRGVQPDTATAPDWLMKIVADRDAAARFGRAYLDTHPAEQSGETLLKAIDAAIVTRLGAGADTPMDTQQLLVQLQQLVRAEYAAGQTLVVGGWVLSATEARLYAAVTVLSD